VKTTYYLLCTFRYIEFKNKEDAFKMATNIELESYPVEIFECVEDTTQQSKKMTLIYASKRKGVENV